MEQPLVTADWSQDTVWGPETTALHANLSESINMERYVEGKLQDLKVDMFSWLSDTKRAMSQHERDTVDAERRYRLKQMAGKQDELDRTLDALQDEKVRTDHLYECVHRSIDLVSKLKMHLRGMSLVYAIWNKWREYTNRSRVIRLKYARFIQRFEGKELLRRAFKSWSALTYDNALARYQETTHDRMASVLASTEATFQRELRQRDEEMETMRKALDTERRMRIKLEEDMRQSFMRGVCALNMEAISVLKRGVSHPTMQHDPAGMMAAAMRMGSAPTGSSLPFTMPPSPPPPASPAWSGGDVSGMVTPRHDAQLSVEELGAMMMDLQRQQATLLQMQGKGDVSRP